MIYSTVFYLDGARYLYNVEDSQRYQEKFEEFYQRLSNNDHPEIRYSSIGMLIAYARQKKDYGKAEELINKLPYCKIDREAQQAILYRDQGKYIDAEKIWEHKILKGVIEIQSALLDMIVIALQENRSSDADCLAQKYESISNQFSLPKWQHYIGYLQVAMDRKDKDESISILSKMLPDMKKEWKPKNNILYRHIEGSDVTTLSTKVANSFCEQLKTDDEYAYLQECKEFEELMIKINNV